MLRTIFCCSCLLLVTGSPSAVADSPSRHEAAEITRHEVSQITVALKRCDKGDADMCFEAAHEVARLEINLRREYTPDELRKRGWALLEDHCERDDAAACATIGARMLDAKEIDRAIDLLARACTLKDGASCLSLGNLYRTQKHDTTRSREYFGKACDAGTGRGCLRLADTLATQGKPDREILEVLYRKGCKGDDGISCTRSGEDRRAKGDRVGAYVDLFRACELGQTESCYTAATLATCEKKKDDKKSDTKDNKTAKSDKKADKKDDKTDNPERARLLMLRACDGRLAKGCSALADMLLVDEAGGRNWGKAITFAEKACALDHAKTCKQADKIRKHPPDWHCQGEKDCEKLCREGIGKSCEQYASYLEDETKAYEVGCEAGDRESCKRLQTEKLDLAAVDAEVHRAP
jgi:TPR repeat protein